MKVKIDKENIMLTYDNESDFYDHNTGFLAFQYVSARDPEETEKERIKFSFVLKESELSIKITPLEEVEMNEVIAQLEQHHFIKKNPGGDYRLVLALSAPRRESRAEPSSTAARCSLALGTPGKNSTHDSHRAPKTCAMF